MKCFLVALLIALRGSDLAGQGTLSGIVRDMFGRGMMDVFVSAHPIGRDGDKPADRTDRNGQYTIVGLAPGRYRIDFVRVGYMVRSDTVDIPMTAGAQPVALDAALVRMPSSAYFNITEPNYFIANGQRGVTPGTYANAVKFRIAVRYELLGRKNLNQTGLYLGYTQNSFWNIWEPSAPFLDNNYSPRVFGYWDAADWREDLRFLPSLRLAFEHESNGRDGPTSRSWNRVAFDAGFGEPTSTVWYGFLKSWIPLGMDDNPDLQDYVGRGEIDIYWQPGIHQQRNLAVFGAGLKTRVWGKQAFANQELDVFWGFKASSNPGNARGRWHPSLLFQLFNGTGENLLLYRERRTVFRVGLATVR